MGTDDESSGNGDSSGNSGSHPRLAPSLLYAQAPARRSPRPVTQKTATATTDCNLHSTHNSAAMSRKPIEAAANANAATWTSNVARWRTADSPSSPRARPATKRVPLAQWHLEPQHRYDGDTESSSSSLASTAAGDEPDAESPLASSAAASTAVHMAPLVAFVSKEHTPLLQHDKLLHSNEARPNIRTEFLQLATLATPVIVTYVLEFLPGIVSMTIVGHLESPLTKEYVDAVSLSTMFFNLTAIAFGFGLATAMDTLCAQAYGAGKPRQLGIYLQSGLLVLGAALIPVGVLNWYTEQCLLWMGQPAAVAALAGRFSRIVLPGLPCLYVYELLKKLLQAQNIVLPMVAIAVVSNVVNIALGIYLSFYTSLGFDGAAIARTAANAVLPLALAPLFLAQPQIVREWWPGWQWRPAIAHVRAFLTLGIPGMAMMLLEWWSFEIMAVCVGRLPSSVVAISVHSVLVSVSTMAFNFFFGIAVATNIRVGVYVGRNQPKHAQLAATLGMGLALGVSTVLAVLVIATRDVLPQVFINDATSIALAAHALLVLLPYQMLDAINSVMQGVFRGTGRNGLGALINLFAYFALGLPLGLYLAFRLHMGVEGLWLGLTAGICSGCVVSIVKVVGTDWRAMADAARVRTTD